MTLGSGKGSFYYTPPSPDKVKKEQSKLGKFSHKNSLAYPDRLPLLSKPFYKFYDSLIFPSRFRVGKRKVGQVKAWELTINFRGKQFPETVDESKKK